MTLLNRIFLFTLLCTVMITCKKTSTQNELLTLDEVINRYYVAIGGYENLKSIKTKITRGTYVEPGYGLILSGETIGERGDKRLVKGKGEIIGYFYEAYNGSEVWEFYKGDEKPRIMDGEAEKAARRGAEFDESFVDYKEKGHNVSLTGIELLDGHLVYKITVILNDGFEKIYYIDSETFLIRAMRKSQPLHAKGDDINFLVFYDQWREVDGILMPFVTVERDIDSNFKMISARVIDEIILNADLDTINYDPHIPVDLD